MKLSRIRSTKMPRNIQVATKIFVKLLTPIKIHFKMSNSFTTFNKKLKDTKTVKLFTILSYKH